MQTKVDSRKACEAIPDRRQHSRYLFSTPITIHPAGGAAMPGIGIEISESGMSAITVTG